MFCRRYIRWFLLLAALVVGRLENGHCAAQENQGFLIEDAPFEGALRGFTDEQHLSFTTPAGMREVGLDELVLWGAARDSAEGIHVLLSDGSLIVAQEVRIEGKDFAVDSNLWGKPLGFDPMGTVKIPLAVVRGVIFRVPLVGLERDRLIKDIIAATGNEDRAILVNGDTVAGTIRKLDYAGESETSPAKMTLSMETRDGQVALQADRPQGMLQEKVVALIMNPNLVRRSISDTSGTLVGFRDGTCLQVAAISPVGKEAEFQLECGIPLESNPELNIWNEVVLLQPQSPKVTYLSEIPALGYIHLPQFTLQRKLGTNQNVQGGKLRSAQEVYSKGLGMPGNSRVAFSLDKPYRRLEGAVAIDDAAGTNGSVRFIVLGSGADGKFRPIFNSSIVRGGDAPVPLSLDIAAMKRLALIVDAADFGQVRDEANWLNLRLIE